MTLANFSEFGLIVASFAVAANFIPADWLVTIAISLSITFIISTPLNFYAHSIYAATKKWFHIFETSDRLEYDKTFDIGNAQILILGMGKLGSATYDQLSLKYEKSLLALDYNQDVVEKHKNEGRNIVQDDATDSEFWERIANSPIRSKQIKMIMLCMNDHKSNIYAVKRLQAIKFNGIIAAIAKHDDEIKELNKLNVHAAYNIYSEAGLGFADHVCFKYGKIDEPS